MPSPALTLANMPGHASVLTLPVTRTEITVFRRLKVQLSRLTSPGPKIQ